MGSASRVVVPLLRVVLLLTFGMVALLQVMSVPGTVAHSADRAGGFSVEHWVVLGVFEAELLCVQVVVVATWWLLGMVRQGRIFRDEAFGWVDLIIGAVAVAWVVWLGFGLTVAARADDPGPIVMVAVIGLAITVVGLLLVVMRALLQQATSLRTDMDAVI